MQVTIILEEFNLSSTYQSTSAKESAEKILKLRVSRHLQIYLLAIILGIGCLLIQMPIIGISIICISTLAFLVFCYFKNAFDVEINFSKSDTLDEIVKEDLFD